MSEGKQLTTIHCTVLTDFGDAFGFDGVDVTEEACSPSLVEVTLSRSAGGGARPFE